MPRHPIRPAALGGVVVLALATLTLIAGPLDPPSGPVAPTYKTLAEVEPRTAINSTNTRGDADSVFKIILPGSYYLTGNITGISGKHAVEIAADNVSIDLMGFEVVGDRGTLDGIHSDGPRDNITIRNGVVRDFDGVGVAVASPGQIGLGGVLADLLIAGNGIWGCFPNDNSTVRNCVAQSNGATGFLASQGVVFASCLAADNAGAGFDVSGHSTFTGCVARSNGSAGFSVLGSSTITDCTANLNAGDGFFTIGSVTVSGCVASENDGDGIEAWFQSVIVGNLCSSNGFGAAFGAGIRIVSGEDNRIEGNNCSYADRGILVESAGNLILRNNCSGNTINYEFAAHNRYGPVIDITAGGTPAVSGNSAADTTGTTHPWANFAH